MNIKENQVLKSKDCVLLVKKLSVTDLAGEKVMIDFETGKYYMLKGVANDIWDFIQSEITVEEIENRLLDSYDVDRSTCQKSVNEFLLSMLGNGFIAIKDQT